MVAKKSKGLRSAGRLIAHHRGLYNARPSAQNPATKVGEIFDVIGSYLNG